MLNQEQIEAYVRQALLTLSSGLVTHGYMTDAQLQIVVGAVIVLGTVAWGQYKRRAKAIVASAAALPEVHGIVAPQLASVPSDKVVASVAQLPISVQ